MSYEYKDATLPWLSQIPKHLELVRNKTVLKETKETVGTNHGDYQLLSLTKGGVIIRDLSTGKGKFPSDFGTYKIVRDGQIIFCLFDIDETPRTVGVSKYNGMITGAYDVFSISGVNPRYLEYYYLSLDDVKAMRPLYTGLRKVIGVNTFMETHIPLPPREEQDQIVRYLDWKVSQINKLINAKRRQIALLQEQRKSIINNSIAAANAKTIRLKNIADVFIGLTYNPASLTDGVGTAVLRANNIQNGKLVWDGMAYVDCKVPDKLRLQKGDILVCSRNGSRSLIGKCGIVTDEFAGSTFGAFNTVVRSEFWSFLYYVINSQIFSDQAGAFSTSTINQLTLGMFNAMAFPFPQKDVQDSIVLFLDKQCSRIDKIICKIAAEIALIAEYRTRLISDVVTGKKDVRSAVVPQYEMQEDCGDPESKLFEGEDEDIFDGN